MKKIKEFFINFIKLLPGLILAGAVGTGAWFIGKLIPLIGGPVFAILMGMMIAFIPRGKYFSLGLKFTSKKILQWAVILLGFEMNLMQVFRTGAQSLAVMLVTVSAALLIAFIFTKLMRIDSKTGILIGVGTSICGGSAIAATAPVIGADDDEIAHSISTIFLFNVIAVFVFPVAGHLLKMSDAGFGLWAGTAINDTSSVLAAAYTFSDSAGQYATIVKLTRTLLIIPITLILSLYFARKESRSGNSNFSFVKVFPWFVIGFLFAALIRTVGWVGEEPAGYLATCGKFMITMAMAAIGLNTHLIKLLKNGLKPILLGLLCWIAVAGSSLLVQKLAGML